MAKSIAELKKGRGTAMADLQKQVEKLNKTWEKDERFWQPTADKAGTGSAIIRFLPGPKGEDMNWVRLWSHSFQGPTGKWYIENSLTTLNQEDPVSQLNSTLWNSGDVGKEVARKQKRKLSYISNILVVSDPANSDNDGKVFLYKYGTKIFEKIKDAMNPPAEFKDETPINPFDFWEGADFKLKFRKVDGYRSYDKSAFADPKPVSSKDPQIEALWDSEHSLQEFIDAKNFKPYDELKKKLDSVLKGGSVGTSSQSEETEEEEEVLPTKSRRVEEEKPTTKSSKGKKIEEEEETPAPKKGGKTTKPASKKVEDDEDDVLAHFAELAND